MFQAARAERMLRRMRRFVFPLPPLLVFAIAACGSSSPGLPPDAAPLPPEDLHFADFGSHSSAPIGQASDAASGDGTRLGGLLRTPIDDLELSVRSVNSLKNSNIRTLGDLVRQTESQILQVKNFGKKSLQEIADLLDREGLNFGMRFEEGGDGSAELGGGLEQCGAITPGKRRNKFGADDEAADTVGREVEGGGPQADVVSTGEVCAGRALNHAQDGGRAQDARGPAQLGHD